MSKVYVDCEIRKAACLLELGTLRLRKGIKSVFKSRVVPGVAAFELPISAVRKAS